MTAFDIVNFKFTDNDVQRDIYSHLFRFASAYGYGNIWDGGVATSSATDGVMRATSQFSHVTELHYGIFSRLCYRFTLH